MLFDRYRFVPAKWHSSRRGFVPDLVVIHYTAGRGDVDALANYFKRGTRKVSAHFGIGRNGDIVQMVDTSYSAWHAGKSRFRDDRVPVGWRSIGIELCNAGSRYKGDDAIKRRHRNPASRSNSWEPYPCEQLRALESLVKTLRDELGVKFVTGHEDIRNTHVVKGLKGSKTDPGPAFPWDAVDWHGLEQWHWSFKDRLWYDVKQGEAPTT